MTDREQLNYCPNCRRSFTTPQGLGMHIKHGCSLSDKKSFTLGKQSDREQLCKEFTELTGGHWHEWELYQGNKCRCGIWRYFATENPTYTNPADVLRVMKPLDRINFISSLISQKIYSRDAIIASVIDLFIEPDALLKAAVEFLKEGKK